MAEKEEVLTLEKLKVADRPSVFMLGMVGAQVLREHKIAVFMVDVLGNVQVMSPDSVVVLKRPRVEDEYLDLLTEDDALQVLIAQGDGEETIIQYLEGRKGRGVHADAGLRQNPVLPDVPADQPAEVREEPGGGDTTSRSQG